MAKKKSRKEKKSKSCGDAPECQTSDIETDFENVHDSCHDHLQCSTSDDEKDGADKDISNLTKLSGDSQESGYKSSNGGDVFCDDSAECSNRDDVFSDDPEECSNRDDVFCDDPTENMIKTFKRLSDGISNYKGTVNCNNKQYLLKQLNNLTVQVEKLQTEDTNSCLDNIHEKEKFMFMPERDASATLINPLADLEAYARQIGKLVYGFNEISEFSRYTEKNLSSESEKYSPDTEFIQASSTCFDENFNENGGNFYDGEPVYIKELIYNDIVRLAKFLHTPLSGQPLWVELLYQMIDKGHINLQKIDITGCKYPDALKIGETFMTCISTRRPGLRVDFFNNICEKHGRSDISQLLQPHLGKKTLLTDIPHLERCNLEKIIGCSHYYMSGDCHWKSLAGSLSLDNEVIQEIELCASRMSSRMEMEEVTNLLKTRCPSLTLQTIQKSLRELQIINAADEMQVIIAEKYESMKYRGGVAVPESVSLDDSSLDELEIVMN